MLLIVIVHGARDKWAPRGAMFASRCFAFLQVNFHGSVGFGTYFGHAG